MSVAFAPTADRATIGLLAELFDMTPRAIRHYEDRGLVRPSRDGRNRRIYSAGDRIRLQMIAVLRRADVPLRDIRRLLARSHDPAELHRSAVNLMRARRDHLARELAALDSAIREFGVEGS